MRIGAGQQAQIRERDGDGLVQIRRRNAHVRLGNTDKSFQTARLISLIWWTKLNL